MPITLTPAQEAWFQSYVARGDFPSVEAAARQAIDERIAEDRRLKAEPNREILLAGDLSDDDLADIAASDMSPRHNHLDHDLT